MEKNEQQMPRLGEPVPAFEAMTTKGKISFPDDYKGKWVILFSHPADFTPVCTSEFMKTVLVAIHEESVRHQQEVMKQG
jgi:peroxiredoxin (alkyl hydroperoxide reductase subunit C)